MVSVVKFIREIGCCAIILVATASATPAQETGRIPLGKPKEAAAKTDDAAATAGKSLQGVKDAAPAKPSRFRRESSPAKASEKSERVDLNLPAKTAEAKTVKRTLSDDSRDPFRPATMRKKVVQRPRENLSPLERFELNQLKIVGVIWDQKESRAMVEDSAGLGYTIKVGTPIGSGDGVVKAIHRNEVVVEEFYFDVYGARKKRDVSMKLLTE